MEASSAGEAGRACGRQLAKKDVAAVGELLASTELLEAVGHLAWIREHGRRGDAEAFVRAFVDAYRAYTPPAK
jgi:hypothetical protein